MTSDPGLSYLFIKAKYESRKHEISQLKMLESISAFPKKPVISGYDRLKLGEENILHCEGSSIHPSEMLEVQWLYGDTVLQQSYEGQSERDAYSLPLKFTPSEEDDGKAITCRASLRVDNIPADEMTKETSAPMTVLCKLHWHTLYKHEQFF